MEEAAGKDGCMVPNYLCVMGFLHSISITDNEELKHHSLMHEKKGLHRAGYSQAMIILMKLTLIGGSGGSIMLPLFHATHYKNDLCKTNLTIRSFPLK